MPYLNNYAYALAKLGCESQARMMINKALAYKPSDVNALDTQQQISNLTQEAVLSSKNSATQCPLIRM